MPELVVVLFALSLLYLTVIGVQRGWFSGIPYQADGDWYVPTTKEFCKQMHRHLWIDGRTVFTDELVDGSIQYTDAYNCPACQGYERVERVIV
jgi:hypothetical protein